MMTSPEGNDPFSNFIGSKTPHNPALLALAEKARANSHVEELRGQLVTKYQTDVFEPRLKEWEAFDSYFKGMPPQWFRPDLLGHVGISGQGFHSSYKSLVVAKWFFKRIFADKQIETETIVSGHDVGDGEMRHITHGWPKINVGTFLLGRNKTIREASRDKWIQNINGYSIETKWRNLITDDTETHQFTGPHIYETFATIDQMKAAGRSYTSKHVAIGGMGFRSRPETFSGVFSAPITIPVELSSKKFIPRFMPDGQLDLAGTIADHQYLFAQTPTAIHYGEINTSDDKEIFKTSGNEALAYIQAMALLQHVQLSSPAEYKE